MAQKKSKSKATTLEKELRLGKTKRMYDDEYYIEIEVSDDEETDIEEDDDIDIDDWGLVDTVKREMYRKAIKRSRKRNTKYIV